MKNILTIIVILTSWISVNAQIPYESIEIKTDNSYQYVSTYNSSARQKYTDATKWLETSIENYDNSIITDDSRSFRVEFKPEIQYDQTDALSHYLVASISVDCRDDKFRVKLEHIRRKTVTKTCNYLTSPNDISKKCSYNLNTELKQFENYSQLAKKKTLTANEERTLKDLKKHYGGMTKESVTEKAMKPYNDLQKAIATLIDGIEKAIKGEK